ASGSPVVVPTQFVVNAAPIPTPPAIAEQVICSPGLALTVVGTNITGIVPAAGGFAVPAKPSWMLLIVIVHEPVLVYVPVVPAPAGILGFASNASAIGAAKTPRDGLPRVIKSPPFPSGLVWWPYAGSLE